VLLATTIVGGAATAATAATASTSAAPGSAGGTQSIPLGAVHEVVRGVEGARAPTLGPDGNVWFVTHNRSIGRVAPDRSIAVFADPAIAYPQDVVAGPDGNVWFTNEGSGQPSTIGRISPDGATVTTFGAGTVFVPHDLTVGPDGALWFTQSSATSAIGRITTSGALTTFTDPAMSGVEGITSGPDGALWFTNSKNHTIGRITTAGVVTSFADASVFRPHHIVSGPDGRLWFTNENGKVGQITTAGVITSVSIGSGAATDLAVGPDGNVWGTVGPVADHGNRVVRVTPAGVVTTFPLAAAKPSGITLGAGGQLWITATGPDPVAELALDGTITGFGADLPLAPQAVAAGTDGAAWYVDLFGHLGRVAPSGPATRFAGPSDPVAVGVAPAGAGAAWFTDQANDQIGRITPAGVVERFSDPSISGPTLIDGAPDGSAWFLNATTQTLGHITAAGVVTDHVPPLGEIAQPIDLAVSPNGSVWMANTGNPGGSLVRFDPALGFDLSYFPSNPSRIAAAPDGSVWVVDGLARNGLTHISSAMAVIGGAALTWDAIADVEVAADGAAWALVAAFPAAIGRFVRATDTGVSGSVESVALVGGGRLARAPSGDLWYANAALSTLGRLELGGRPSEPRDVRLVPRDGAVRVAWDPPVIAGDGPITSYTVTAQPGGSSCTRTSAPLLCDLGGLTNGSSYTVSVVATNVVGSGPPATATGTPAVVHARYTPLVPHRVLDSRDGTGGATAPWSVGESRDLTVVGGDTGVPLLAEAVVLNVTGVLPTATTHLTVWPTGSPQPATSNLNLPAGSVRPNLVTVQVGGAGRVSIFNSSGQTEVVADVVGYYDLVSGGGYVPTTPVRVVDSRDGTGTSASRWGPGEVRTLAMGSAPSPVTATASAVVVNVTATQVDATTHLTLWPTGQAQPLASNLNVAPGQTAANLAIVRLGPSSSISVRNNSGHADVILDVVGYVDVGGATFTPIAPTRILDSRDGTGTSVGPWTPHSSRDVIVAGGTTPVPGVATGVVVNLTGVASASPTHLTVWPTGQAMPVASNLNLPAFDVRANLTMPKVGDGGAVSIANNDGSTQVIGDVVGYFS